MSKLTKKDLHTPFNGAAISRIMGHILAARSEQYPAATLAAALMLRGVVPAIRTTQDLYVLFGVAFGAGESLTVDVLVNGVSILAAPYVLDATQAPKTQIKLPISAAFITVGKVLNAGDRIQVNRTYVAGGAPTAPANTIVLEAA